MAIASYTILNYDEIHKDVAARNKIITDYKCIIQRRIKIQCEYLNKMKQLSALPQLRKIPNATKATEFLYNSLINAIYAQVDNISNHVSRMDSEINKNLISTIIDLDNQSKRQLLTASNMLKQYDKKHEDIEKLKVKMLKKGLQLKKLKQQYIVGTLIDMPFDKKNKLFIRTKQIEQVYRPLHDQFYQAAKTFNDKSLQMANRLQQIILNIQKGECQKVEAMKKIFMVLQISNSEYGANLIQDKASILSRINQLQAANPQFIKCPQQNKQQHKKQFLLHLHDPCLYINSLFTNIIDTKNMQNIVIYGHENRHRESISESMTDSQATQLREEESDLAHVREIASCFKNIFNDTIQLDTNKSKRLAELMQNSVQNRKNFILCLQKFRTLSKFDISDKKLNAITNILESFLDSCLNCMDTYNSKFLLVLSLTYYIKIGNQRVDLHNYIKNHKIWKDKQWWQCALLESSYEQLKIKLPKKLQQVPITIWHIKGSGLKHSESQQQLTAQNVLFNQLVFYIHNMRIFDIREQLITFVAKKYAKYFQFNSKIVSSIESQLKVFQIPLQDMDLDLMSPVTTPNLKKKFIRKLF